ncbi:MAG: HIT family protein [Chloroflexi bacterium]|nr:HIT family protein [Chloroflexota bacterium]
MNYQRYPVDIPAYTRRSQSGPCFICQIIAGEMREQHPILYEDDTAIVFFSKHQLLYGYTLVAPRRHREAVTSDFTLEEYLALQKIVYQVAETLRQEVPTERMYILSLGSQQGNRHVHWHLVPLPPGVPYEEQQLAALDLRKGGLNIPDDDLADLAARLNRRLLKMKETFGA